MIYANFKKGDMMVEENEKSFSFEEKLDELEKIVNKLETGQVPLGILFVSQCTCFLE